MLNMQVQVVSQSLNQGQFSIVLQDLEKAQMEKGWKHA